jgi:hypothetical protein
MSHICLPKYGHDGRLCWCGRIVPKDQTRHEIALNEAIANGWTLRQAAEYAAGLRNNVVNLAERRSRNAIGRMRSTGGAA